MGFSVWKCRYGVQLRSNLWHRKPITSYVIHNGGYDTRDKEYPALAASRHPAHASRNSQQMVYRLFLFTSDTYGAVTIIGSILCSNSFKSIKFTSSCIVK